MLPLILVGRAALGAEVVWLTPPSAADAARVGHQAGATGGPMTPADLLAARTHWTAQDDDAQKQLALALSAVRQYEDALDGEKLILRDLDRPIADVGVLRDERDRLALYTALAYQGFAANRYYAESLGTAEGAAPYRRVIEGSPIERPWVDAIALEPDRDASPYEIAEAPQRVAYNFTRGRMGAVVPGTLTPDDLPSGAVLVVDGRPTALSPSGNVKVRPGRNLIHAELDGRIIARWDLEIAPGADVSLVPPVTGSSWAGFLAAIDAGTVPAPLPLDVGALITAVGGEVWFVRAGESGPTAVSVSMTGTHSVPLGTTVATIQPAASFGVMGGWLSSGDFYNQDPVGAPNTVGTVNAVSVGGWAEGGVRYGPLHVEGGVDLLVPLGAHHAALTGDTSERARPIPYASMGIGPVGLAAGYLFPYHPAIGAHLVAPIGPLVWRGVGWVGIPVARRREGADDWIALPVFTAATGIGARF